jgi:prolyl 4-hydroxylase
MFDELTEAQKKHLKKLKETIKIKKYSHLNINDPKYFLEKPYFYKEHKINNKFNFIAGYYLNNLSLCDDIIDYFESSSLKTEGKLAGNRVEKWVKNSTDLSFSVGSPQLNTPCIINYLNELKNIITEYKLKYRYANEDKASWAISEGFNIQKYLPGNRYSQWHSERGTVVNCTRHLVFMTFLNDIKNEGGTEFYYQKTKINPEKGLTLIWPSDWTHTHRGVTAPNETKYILTGWYNFIQ